jgi:hypothetical protein
MYSLICSVRSTEYRSRYTWFVGIAGSVVYSVLVPLSDATGLSGKLSIWLRAIEVY